MRSKSIVLLVLALGCGLIASIGISQFMDARNRAPVDQGEKTPVFVAMTDISPNELLTPKNIKLEEWPKNLVPQGALTKLEEVENKRSKIKLYAGETILASKLLGPNEAIGAAAQIPQGYRVAYVKVDALSGSSNLILPGDRVDVLVYRNTSNDMAATAAKIVLQDVRVFAVDTQTEYDTRTKGEHGDPISAKIIQLLVTPDQAVILHMASEISGSVRLVLRNPEDDAHVSAPTASLGDIFGPEIRTDRGKEQVVNPPTNKTSGVADWLEQQKPEPKLAVAPINIAEPRRMVLILGSEVSTVEIPDNGDVPQTPRWNPQDDSNSSDDSTDASTDETTAPYLPMGEN